MKFFLDPRFDWTALPQVAQFIPVFKVKLKAGSPNAQLLKLQIVIIAVVFFNCSLQGWNAARGKNIQKGFNLEECIFSRGGKNFLLSEAICGNNIFNTFKGPTFTNFLDCADLL